MEKRKILMVLILLAAASAVILLNLGIYPMPSEDIAPDFEVDQMLVKVLVKKGEAYSTSLKVMNIGKDDTRFNITVSGVEDMVSISADSFSLKPGQTKLLKLDFDSVLSGKDIIYEPGVYVGKISVSSSSGIKDIPMIMEIESKDVLFDINIVSTPTNKEILRGTQAVIELRLFNLKDRESNSVVIKTFVKDINGNIIMTETESSVVESQTSFVKTLSVPENIKPGDYVFITEVVYGDSVGTSSYLFNVIDEEKAEKTPPLESLLSDRNVTYVNFALICVIIIILFFISMRPSGQKEVIEIIRKEEPCKSPEKEKILEKEVESLERQKKVLDMQLENENEILDREKSEMKWLKDLKEEKVGAVKSSEDSGPDDSEKMKRLKKLNSKLDSIIDNQKHIDGNFMKEGGFFKKTGGSKKEEEE